MTGTAIAGPSSLSRRFGSISGLPMCSGVPGTFTIPVTPTLLSIAACIANRGTAITQEDLVHRTQDLFDGVTAGDPKPFERYFAEDAMDHDEKGRSMDKKAQGADITPPPPHWSGAITISHPESRLVGTTAILSCDLDDTETLSRQTVQARYHTTDTWLLRGGIWQIVAEQAFRHYADPAQGKPDIARYADYTGVYELEPGQTRTVSSEGDSPFVQN